MFSHILGQIDDNNNGISGLEKTFDYELEKEALEKNAKSYLNRIDTLCGCPVTLVGVGPDRKETLTRN